MWLMFLSLSKELYSTTAHQVPWHGLDDDEGGSWCPICLLNMEDSPRSYIVIRAKKKWSQKSWSRRFPPICILVGEIPQTLGLVKDDSIQ